MSEVLDPGGALRKNSPDVPYWVYDMDESFGAILRYFKLTSYPPSLGTIIVFIVGCILLCVAILLNLRTQRRKKRKSINPCWIGSLFLDYCLRKGWVTKDVSEGKNTKWYLTETGREELKEQFGIKIDSYDS